MRIALNSQKILVYYNFLYKLHASVYIYDNFFTDKTAFKCMKLTGATCMTKTLDSGWHSYT